MDLLWKVDVNNLLQIQWKWLNRQYIRVLIPKNSIINKSVINNTNPCSYTKPINSIQANKQINYKSLNQSVRKSTNIFNKPSSKLLKNTKQ